MRIPWAVHWEIMRRCFGPDVPVCGGWECDNADYAAVLKHYEPGVYRIWAEEDRYDQRAWGVAALIAAGKALKARVFIRRELLRDRQAEAFAKAAGREKPGG